MPHLTKNNPELIKRVRRLKGQIEGIERMLVDGADCYKILQNTAACRGALNSLTKELIVDHIQYHIAEREGATPEIKEASEEVKSIINSFFK